MVLEGEILCGERWCTAGTHIELPQGTAFGFFVGGPKGAILFEVMMNDFRGWGDDLESFERVLALHGAQALPTSAIELSLWLKDLCERWGVDSLSTEPLLVN